MTYNCIILNLVYVLFPVNEVIVLNKAGLCVLQSAEKKSVYGPLGFFLFSSQNCFLQIAQQMCLESGGGNFLCLSRKTK